MKTKEIEQGNKLIADFMNFEPIQTWEQEFNNEPMELKYHESWDWLMPIVEKIETIDFEFSIRGKSVTVYNKSGNNPYFQPHEVEKSKIESIYKAIIRFINWYNKNK